MGYTKPEIVTAEDLSAAKLPAQIRILLYVINLL